MNEQGNIKEQNLSILKIFIMGLAPGVLVTLLAIVFSSPLIGFNFNVLNKR